MVAVDEVVEVAIAEVMAGGVVSIVTGAFKQVETFPTASFAQAYKVLTPSDEKVYEVGAEAVQPASLVKGGADDSVSL
jgi:hypothetical protein